MPEELKFCTECGAVGDHDTDNCPFRLQPDELEISHHHKAAHSDEDFEPEGTEGNKQNE